MAFLGQSKPSYLGIDFGAGGVKLVELMNEKGRARLVTYAFVDRAVELMEKNPIEDPAGTAELLRKMLKKARTTTRRAVSALPIASVFSSIISVQKSPKHEELEAAVQYQAKKLIPLPLEEMTVDWKPIATPTPAADEKYLQVLLTGAAKSLIAKYTSIFSAAGLELLSLETEALAIIRALIGRDRSPTLVLDIGTLRTNILIIENGIPLVSRSVAQGGLQITREMASALGLPAEQAESMKIDAAAMASMYAGGFPKLFEKALAPILSELTYSTNLFLGQKANENKRLDKIILTGGGALLPQLSEHLSKAASLRVYVGDPWARVVYPEALRPVLNQIGPRFAAAVGLAMRDID